MEENDARTKFYNNVAQLISQLNVDDCKAVIRAINGAYFDNPKRSRNLKDNASLNLENCGFYHEEMSAIQTQIDEFTNEAINTTERLTKEYLDKCRPIFQERYEIVSKVTEDGGVAEPYFWLSALKAHSHVRKLITENDLLVLEYLRDIRYYTTPDPASTERYSSYKLKFIFDPKNPYFSNTVLSKVFDLSYKNGGFIGKAKGTTIHWNKDRSNERFSFFNLFETKNMPREEDGEDALREYRSKLSFDFHYCAKPIFQDVIPLAYTLCGYPGLKQRKVVKKLRKKGGKEVAKEGGSEVGKEGRKVAKKGRKRVAKEGDKVAKKRRPEAAKEGGKVAEEGGSEVGKEGRKQVAKEGGTVAKKRRAEAAKEGGKVAEEGVSKTANEGGSEVAKMDE